MNKKILSLFLVLVLTSLVAVGCSSGENNATTSDKTNEPSSEGLQDGSYLVKMSVNDHGNYPLATMEVKGGEIVEFDYSEYLADSGEEKNKDNYNYPEGLEVIQDLNDQFAEKKSLDEIDFDAVSGATHTKGNFKEVVSLLLEKSEKGEIHEPIYKDGEYEAKADEASHGWQSQIKVVVKDGVIVGVDFYDVAVEDMESEKVVLDDEDEPVMKDDETPKTEPVEVKKGDRKSIENYAYLNPFETINELQKQIIDSDGLDGLALDAVSGATNTKETMLELAEKALENAK